MTRAALPLFLLEAAKRDDCPYVLTADLAIPLGLVDFASRRPDRFLDVGIAEQCLVAVAAGMSSGGTPAIATTFASFAMRAFEAFRNLAVYDDLHVVVVGANAGIATGPNGPTHHATEDLAVFSAIDGVTCFSPRCVDEALACLMFAVSTHGQYYIRLARWEPARVVESAAGMEASMGAPWYVSYPADVSLPQVVLFSHGVTWNIVCNVVDRLHRTGVTAQAIHIGRFPLTSLPTVTPSTRLVVTVEDHNSRCGLGGLVAAAMSGVTQSLQIGAPWPLGSDDAEVLYERAGLTSDQVFQRVRTLLT